MLRETINQKIKEAMKAKNQDSLYVLKMIKAKFLEFETSKGFKEEDFNMVKEVSILQKMAKSWEDELDMFKQANRDTTELENRLNILKSFLPVEASDEDIKQVIVESGIEPCMKNMKQIMQVVQDKYPTANGKQISGIIKSMVG